MIHIETARLKIEELVDQASLDNQKLEEYEFYNSILLMLGE